MLVFTDGAFEAEQELATVGGILCDDTGKPLRFFSERVPKLMLQALMEEAQNLIYLIELLAAYLAVFLWGGLHSSRYVVAYINSSTKLGNAMVRMFVNLEDNSQWKIWFVEIWIALESIG